MTLGIGVIYLNVRYVLEDSRRTVTAFLELEQLRRFVDELGVALALDEGRVREYVRDEGDIRLDASDVLLVYRPRCLAADGGEGAVPACDLDEEGVVVGGDGGAGRNVAAVETDTEAAAGAVADNSAVVGCKLVCGVLGGDTALNGVAVNLQVVLICKPDLGMAHGTALRNEYLRTDKVDVRYHLGDGMLDLDTGVHLDEVVISVTVNEELHCAGVYIADLLGDLDRIGVELASDLRRNAPCGGKLNDLLIAALEGAVTLAEVTHVAVLVGEDLHLDVLRLDKVLFDENIVVAESLLRFAADKLEGRDNVLLLCAEAHTSAAAACRRL